MHRSLALACVLLLLGLAPLTALTRADFDRVVDFSLTLKNLAAVADGTEPLPGGNCSCSPAPCPT